MEKLFLDIVMIWIISILIMLPFARLKFHPILAFIAAGMLIGPHGLKLIVHPENIALLGEIGIILLLFTIGIEFSLKTFWQMRRFTLLGGLLQWSLSTLALTPFLLWLTDQWLLAFAIASTIALSSTALVLNLLQSQGILTTFYGRISTGILVFQDLIAVALMFFLPTLLSAHLTAATLGKLGQGLLFLVVLMVVSIRIIPWMLQKMLRYTSRDTLLLLLITLCFGIGWLTHSIGLSLALGAFVAGLSISESDLNIEAIGHLSPFHSVFANFFFVSIGLALDLQFFLEHFGQILTTTVGIMVLKAGVLTAVLWWIKVPLRFALLAGVLLSQIGEFSLVLLQSLAQNGLLSDYLHNVLISTIVISMIVTPFIASGIPILQQWLSRKVQQALPQLPSSKETPAVQLRDHIIIVGFGIVGRAVAQAAMTAKISYVVIEANYETVQKEKQQGTNILFGDANNPHLLEKAGIAHARIIALTFPHAADAITIIRTVRSLAPELPIIARSLFASQVGALYEAGATEVICDELETGTTMFSQILKAYLLEDRTFLQFREQLRQATYRQAATPTISSIAPSQLVAPDLMLQAITISPSSSLAGKTLRDLDLSQKFGILVVGVGAPNRPYQLPSADTQLHPGDQLLLLGAREKIREFLQQLVKETLSSAVQKHP